MGTFRLIGLGMVIGLITGGALLAGCGTLVIEFRISNGTQLPRQV